MPYRVIRSFKLRRTGLDLHFASIQFHLFRNYIKKEERKKKKKIVQRNNSISSGPFFFFFLVVCNDAIEITLRIKTVFYHVREILFSSKIYPSDEYSGYEI